MKQQVSVSVQAQRRMPTPPAPRSVFSRSFAIAATRSPPSEGQPKDVEVPQGHRQVHAPYFQLQPRLPQPEGCRTLRSTTHGINESSGTDPNNRSDEGEVVHEDAGGGGEPCSPRIPLEERLQGLKSLPGNAVIEDPGQEGMEDDKEGQPSGDVFVLGILDIRPPDTGAEHGRVEENARSR